MGPNGHPYRPYGPPPGLSLGPGGPMGALPPSGAGGPFSASLGFLSAGGVGGRKPFDGPGSPLVPSKLHTSFLHHHPHHHSPDPHHSSLMPPLLSAVRHHREQQGPPPPPHHPHHPLLPHLRPPFIHPSLYPALASLGHGYPSSPSMASFHSVLASLSAYRPGGPGGLGGPSTADLADYASLLRAATGNASSSPPPSANAASAAASAALAAASEAKSRLDSATELRLKAREFELKLEQESHKISEA